MAKKKGIRDYATYQFNPYRINKSDVRPMGAKDIEEERKYNQDRSLATVTLGGTVMTFGDFGKHVRLFDGSLKALKSINNVGLKVLVYIFSEISKDSDEVNLSMPLLMPGAGFNNKVSAYAGILDLLEVGFISKKTGSEIYFINPDYFFRGNRVKWFHKNRALTDIDESQLIYPPSIKDSLKKAVKKQKAEIDAAVSVSKQAPPCVASLSPGDTFSIDGAPYILWKITDDAYLAIDPDLVMAPDGFKSSYAISFEGSELID